MKITTCPEHSGSTNGTHTHSFTPTQGYVRVRYSAANAFSLANVSLIGQGHDTVVTILPTRIAYRYGYQGSERDDEIKGAGNSYTTFYRMLDPRLGRWFSIDPKMSAWESPYASMANNPIKLNDPQGDKPPHLYELIVKGKESGTFRELLRENKIHRGNYDDIIYFGSNGTYTENQTGKISLTRSEDLKFEIIQLTHELTNRKNLASIQELDKQVGEGKISAKSYAKKLAHLELEGQINQIKVAAEIGYEYDNEAVNKIINLYKKDKSIDLTKKIKAGTEHLGTYEEQGKNIRKRFLQKEKENEKKDE